MIVPSASAPAVQSGIADQVLVAYAADLLDKPPVDSLTRQYTPDPNKRQQESIRLAGLAVVRMLRVLNASGMEIVRTEAKNAAVTRLQTAKARVEEVEARHFDLLATFETLFERARDASTSIKGHDLTPEEVALSELIQRMYDTCPFVRSMVESPLEEKVFVPP